MKHSRTSVWWQKLLEIIKHFGCGSHAMYRKYFSTLLGTQSQYFSKHLSLPRQGLIEARSRVQSNLANVSCFLKQSLEEEVQSTSPQPGEDAIRGQRERNLSSTRKSDFDERLWVSLLPPELLPDLPDSAHKHLRDPDRDRGGNENLCIAHASSLYRSGCYRSQ